MTPWVGSWSLTTEENKNGPCIKLAALPGGEMNNIRNIKSKIATWAHTGHLFRSVTAYKTLREKKTKKKELQVLNNYGNSQVEL